MLILTATVIENPFSLLLLEGQRKDGGGMNLLGQNTARISPRTLTLTRTKPRPIPHGGGGAANLWLSELVRASPRGLPAQGQSTENPARLKAGRGPGPPSLLQLD